VAERKLQAAVKGAHLTAMQKQQVLNRLALHFRVKNVTPDKPEVPPDDGSG
jgi:hypothetical protein